MVNSKVTGMFLNLPYFLQGFFAVPHLQLAEHTMFLTLHGHPCFNPWTSIIYFCGTNTLTTAVCNLYHINYLTISF